MERDFETAEAPSPGSSPWGRALLPGSAALVLLGGWIELYRDGPSASTVAVLGGRMLYEGLLLGAAFYLARVRRGGGPVAPFLGILLVFVLDLPLVQHRFGWEPGGGAGSAVTGVVEALVIALVSARILGVAVAGRSGATVLLSVLLSRLGPLLLLGSSEPPWGLAPALVALGWLLPVVLLPAIFLPPESGERGLTPRMEEIGLSAAVAASLLHLLLAGIGFGLRFHVAYLSPFLLLLGPALDRIVPAGRRSNGHELLVALLPWAAVALAAAEITPELIAAGSSWSITPFSLALVALVLLRHAGILPREKRGRVAVDAALLALVLLGGDLAEAFVRLRFPSLWQVVAIALLAGGAARREPFRSAAAGLLALPALVAGSWLAERGIPFPLALLASAGWGAVVAGKLLGISLPEPGRRWLPWGLTLVPLLAFAAGPEGAALPFVAVQEALALLASRWTGNVAFRKGAFTAALAAGVGSLVRGIEIGPVEPGRTLVVAGFALFFVAFSARLFAGRVRGHVSRLLSASRAA